VRLRETPMLDNATPSEHRGEAEGDAPRLFQTDSVSAPDGLVLAQVEPAEVVEEETVADPTVIVTPDPEGVVEPPAEPGTRIAVAVQAGQAIVLEDPLYDPQVAVYMPEDDDLVITLADGSVVVLVGFFGHPDQPPTLSVLEGPAVDATTLLAQVEVIGVEEIEPAAPPPTPPLSQGSRLIAYDPGDLGPGLDPLGPLGPTEIGFPLIDVEFEGAQVDDEPVDEPPVEPPPILGPVAVPDSGRTPKTEPIQIDVLDNDTHEGGLDFRIVGFTQPEHGSVALAEDGRTFIYTPPDPVPGEPRLSGEVSFTYTIEDENGQTSSTTVVVELFNRPPVAVDDSVTTPKNTPVIIDVLLNDSDPDGDPLTIVSFTDPANGTVQLITVDGEQRLEFTPDPGWIGTTTFEYTITDNDALDPLQDTATVTVTVTQEPPSIEVTDEVDVNIGLISIGFPFCTLHPFPFKQEGLTPGDLAQMGVLGVRFVNMIMDEPREVSIAFRKEASGKDNVLGAYLVDPDGNIHDVRILWTAFDDLDPGDAVSLGIVPVGWTVGLFMAVDASDAINAFLGSPGEFAFVNADGQPFKIGDDGPPRLVFVDGDGIVHQIDAPIFHTYDPNPGNTHDNPLNTGGKQQTISGMDFVDGHIVIGFEERQVDDGNGIDFKDLLVDVHIGTVEVVVITQPRVGGDVRITDPDDTHMAAAMVGITAGLQAGDRLFLDPQEFVLDGDGNVLRVVGSDTEGTDITGTYDAATATFEFTGQAPISTYEALLQSVRFANDSDDLTEVAGVREVTFQVTDPFGATSNLATVQTTVHQVITDPAEFDQSAATRDVFMSGTDGDDQMFGGSGDDLLNARAGDNFLSGGEGDDILVSGTGLDIMHGGPGADEFWYTSMQNRTDVILDFNAEEGDRLVLFFFMPDPTTGVPPYPFDPDNPGAFIQLSEVTDFPLIDDTGQLVAGETTSGVLVSIDLDGPGGQYDSFSLVVLTDPVGISHTDSVQDLINQGTIVV
jgi:Ca2+-binding RTX toxin-like protein